MKRWILPLLCFLLLLGGCTFAQAEEELPANVINIVDSAALTQLEALEQPWFLYFGRPTCKDCSKFTPILFEYFKDTRVMIHYYNTDDHRENEDFARVIERYEVMSVPRLLVIANGEILRSYVYDAETEEKEYVVETLAQLEEIDSYYRNPNRSEKPPICPSCEA